MRFAGVSFALTGKEIHFVIISRWRGEVCFGSGPAAGDGGGGVANACCQ